MCKFSIIIPLYNKEKHISDTINSVLNQSFTDFEIIVVNDGSTDSSLAVVKSINNDKIRIFDCENKGASAARNYGMKNATGEYFALLDADDFWQHNYLDTINQLIFDYPNECVYTTAINLQNKEHCSPASYSIDSSEEVQVLNYFTASKQQSLISSSSVVLHRSVIEKVGDFDTTILSGQDTDLWIRIGLIYPIVFINKPYVNYLNVIDSLSNTHTDLNTKCRFNRYLNEEKINKQLKIFIDLNRFSLAILSKRMFDKKNFLFYTKHLDLNNLNYKQKLLLKCNGHFLNLLFNVNQWLKAKNIRLPLYG